MRRERSNGIPSHDTFNRVFAALDPQQFQAGFAAWMQAVAGVLPTQVIAIDGDTVAAPATRAGGLSGHAGRHRLSTGERSADSGSRR